MSILGALGFNWGSEDTTLPDIFPLSIAKDKFVAIDVQNIYRKILTDMFERTDGLKDDETALLWDNCVASENRDGLITLLAKAMTAKADLFLVIDRSVNVIRKATAGEEQIIKESYKSKAEPVALEGAGKGIFITFKNYDVTDMITIYSALEYCTVGSLNKTMNVAKALQVKIKGLRGSVSMADSSVAITQGKTISQGLSDGKDIMLDAEDVVEALQPDLTPTKTSMDMLNQKRAWYLNMPASYITGILNGGLGDTGQADTKAVERGLKVYFFQIGKPVSKALFEREVTFRTEDFQLLDTGLNTLKTFEATSEQFMSAENKLKTVNKLFGFPPDTEGGPEPEPLPDPKAPPVIDPKAKPVV